VTGKEHDDETQLDFFQARYFSAAQGRFTSPDLSETPQAVPYADFTDPQTLNLYSYVRNNPLSKTDPDGHCIEDGCVAEIAIAWLQIYQHADKLALTEEDVQVVWSKGLDKVGVVIWGGIRGIIDINNYQVIRVLLEGWDTPAISDDEWLKGFEWIWSTEDDRV
jgi:RHS repeat-associated protein